MTIYKQQSPTSERLIDWPLILFFALAYAIAWGAFGIVGLIARQSSIGTDWELVSTLGLLLLGLVAGVVVWRNGRIPPNTF
jgi:ABC-type enterochelin transport system permease subunit